MRRSLLVVIASFLTIGALVSFANIPSASAEDLTPEQTAKIKQNCVAIKNTLSQLHASDALLRVNRGQVYESVASKLMETFNDRLSSNHLDNRAMVTVTASYRSALTTFRTDYIAYEQKLSEAINTDCSRQPNTFHTKVQEARKLRITVHDDVEKLHHLIDDYRSSVSSFLLNYERMSE